MSGFFSIWVLKIRSQNEERFEEEKKKGKKMWRQALYILGYLLYIFFLCNLSVSFRL